MIFVTPQQRTTVKPRPDQLAKSILSTGNFGFLSLVRRFQTGYSNIGNAVSNGAQITTPEALQAAAQGAVILGASGLPGALPISTAGPLAEKTLAETVAGQAAGAGQVGKKAAPPMKEKSLSQLAAEKAQTSSPQTAAKNKPKFNL